MEPTPPEFDPTPDPGPQPAAATPAGPPAGLAGSLPKDLGVMLVSAGVLGFVLPGPGAPALLAGGLILWPRAFGKAERWFQRRFPEAHRQGMGHVNRFLTDLERRYPGSTNSDPGPAETE